MSVVIEIATVATEELHSFDDHGQIVLQAYVVNDANLTTGAFTVSATVGGAAINTTGSQSGTHTGTTSATVQMPAVTLATWGPSGPAGGKIASMREPSGRRPSRMGRSSSTDFPTPRPQC